VIRGCQNCRRYGVAGDGTAGSRKNFNLAFLTAITLFQFNHPHYSGAVSSPLFKYVADIPLGRSMKIDRYWFILVFGGSVDSLHHRLILVATLIVEQPAG
jgi:hypothetical protein